jgi:hypothetical protein
VPSADHDRRLKLMRRAVTVGETVLMVSLIEKLRAATRVRMESQQLTVCPTDFPELELHPSTTTHDTVGDNKPAYVTTTMLRLSLAPTTRHVGRGSVSRQRPYTEQ